MHKVKRWQLYTSHKHRSTISSTHTCGVLWGFILRSRWWWASVIAHLRELWLGVHWWTSGYHRHVLYSGEVVRWHPWVGHGMRWHTGFGHLVHATGTNVSYHESWVMANLQTVCPINPLFKYDSTEPTMTFALSSVDTTLPKRFTV